MLCLCNNKTGPAFDVRSRAHSFITAGPIEGGPLTEFLFDNKSTMRPSGGKKADTFDLFFFFLLLLWRLLLCSTRHNELLWAGTQKEWNVKMFLFSMNWLSAIFFDICRCVSIFVLKKIVVNWGLILKIGKIRNWIENNFWGFFGIFKNNFSEFFAIFHFKKLQFF